ncbi:hypothetical protein DHEL01_v208971 [Diaporthe helianthi]|uniref:Glucose-6-phosphate 1-epimerase n=1 Tax=Diaporthe helianthi TaxID=158607 RepID=A0A2P5HQU2_DIAHE|nr:hypothetical protein DHEL01_v208971 [Diaporthe helianthi]
MMLPSLSSLGTACLFLAQAQAGPISYRAASITEGNGTIQATLPSGDAVTVYLHGATVTSWKTSDGDEKLFLSTASALDGSAAIRGGIPVVFPNFASPPKEGQTAKMPSHGFARNSTWTYDSAIQEDDGTAVLLKFTLDSASLTADYKTKWPYSAKLAYTVYLTQDNLNVQFVVENTDDEAIDFQFLLHTYLTVPDITTTTVSGLQGAPYQDKTQNNTIITEESDALTITGETDRIYSPVSVAPIVLKDNGSPRITVERSESLPDTTIWNTWATKILNTKDFAPKDAWQRYLAIEPGYVAKFNSLAPGEVWEASVNYLAH